MFYVYYLRSQFFPNRTYVGYTKELKQKLLDHNAGKSIFTKDFRPWIVIGFFGFNQELKALKFERHLKTNAGRVFLRRYFNDNE